MKRQRHLQAQFGTNPEVDLDRQHQGSIGGQQIHDKDKRAYSGEERISSIGVASGEDLTPGRDPAEGPDVAMTSLSHERWAQHTAERDATEGPAQIAPLTGRGKR